MSRRNQYFPVKRRRLLLATLLCGIVSVDNANAADLDEAQAAAEEFNHLFDSNHPRVAWASTSQYMRDRVTEEAFVSQLVVFFTTFGGPPTLPRQLIQTQTGKEPTTGRTTIAFRFKVRFPAAIVYQDLTFVQEGQSVWKLLGIFFYPAPN